MPIAGASRQRRLSRSVGLPRSAMTQFEAPRNPERLGRSRRTGQRPRHLCPPSRRRSTRGRRSARPAHRNPQGQIVLDSAVRSRTAPRRDRSAAKFDSRPDRRARERSGPCGFGEPGRATGHHVVERRLGRQAGDDEVASCATVLPSLSGIRRRLRTASSRAAAEADDDSPFDRCSRSASDLAEPTTPTVRMELLFNPVAGVGKIQFHCDAAFHTVTRGCRSRARRSARRDPVGETFASSIDDARRCSGRPPMTRPARRNGPDANTTPRFSPDHVVEMLGKIG